MVLCRAGSGMGARVSRYSRASATLSVVVGKGRGPSTLRTRAPEESVVRAESRGPGCEEEDGCVEGLRATGGGATFKRGLLESPPLSETAVPRADGSPLPLEIPG